MINTLQQSVLSHTLGVLVGDIAGSHEIALKLIHPLLQYADHIYFSYDRQLYRALIFCLRLLEEGTPGEDHVRDNSIARLIQILGSWFHHTLVKCTPTQYDMLVDYHLHICEGTDHETIRKTFDMLNSPHGSPSTPDRIGRYVDTMIRFMGHETTLIAALGAACSIRSAVALMGQDNESLRERFSKALASMFPSSTHAPLNKPFTEITFFYFDQDMSYLMLLRTLAQEIIWQPQLHQSSHFDNCLAIAKTLSTEGSQYHDLYAVPVAYIFAIIDDSDEGHPSFHLLQACPSWPLLLRAWRFIFNLDLFEGKKNLYPRNVLSTEDCLAALPSLVSYARKRCVNQDQVLLAVVEQVCSELDKGVLQCEQTETGSMRYLIVGNPGILALGEQMRQLLETAWNDHCCTESIHIS